MRKLVSVLIVLTAAAFPVFSGPIQDIGLFNTGVDASSVVLPSGSDPHYNCAVTSGGGTTCSGAAVVATSGIPSTVPWAWLGANSSSAWIAPIANVANISATVAQGDTVYTYTIPFNLSAYDLSTVTITGQWAADDYGNANLNSGAVFSTIAMGVTNASYATWHAFTISSATAGITSGANTLKFNVTNAAGGGASGGASNPSGLRVEFTGFQGSLLEDGVIPEPGTLALLGGGLLAIGLFRRRRAH